MQDRCWEPGVQYDVDDVVVYQDHRYRIVQPHRSQSDWTPDITQALWSRLSDYDEGCCQQQSQCGQQCEKPQYSQQTPQYQDDNKSEPPPEPHKQHWYEDDSTKKKVEIGAGLAAGAALLAGGLFAYKKHEQHKEEDKARDWSHNNWIEDARARSEGQRSLEPAIWVLTHGKSIPNGAIATGQENGQDLYSSRAFHEGAIVLGKASQILQTGCVIGYGNDEIDVKEYEVLVGDNNRLKWVSASGRLNIADLGLRPVEGGREKDGTPLYIAHAPYKGATQPGKVSQKLDGAYITYGGKEKVIKEYQVLCYN